MQATTHNDILKLCSDYSIVDNEFFFDRWNFIIMIITTMKMKIMYQDTSETSNPNAFQAPSVLQHNTQLLPNWKTSSCRWDVRSCFRVSPFFYSNHSPARLKLFKINWSDCFAINILCNDIFPSEDLEYWMIDAAYMEFCCSEKFFMKRDILQVFHPFNMSQTPFNLFLLLFHPCKIIRS